MPLQSICLKKRAKSVPIYLISPNDNSKDSINIDNEEKTFPEIVQIFAKKLLNNPSDYSVYCHHDKKACLKFVVYIIQNLLYPTKNEINQLLSKIPSGVYHVKETTNAYTERQFSLLWMRQQYTFEHYIHQEKKDSRKKELKLFYNDPASLNDIIETEFYACDLINTPANDLAPHNIEEEASRLAEKHDAEFRSYVGDDLLIENFPLIHAVGGGSHRLPRLVEFIWGEDTHPLISLIGKGVSFDTGGLNIKPDSGMRMMKKDMGGSAHILALARRIMKEKLPIRLQVLLPCVENSVSPYAFRPGDIYSSRAGLSVEIGHTDAEGRLVLADAITYATEFKPKCIITMATLTGAARVAVGPNIVPYFTNSDTINTHLEKAYKQSEEAFWRLPLYQEYSSWLNTQHADISNVANKPFAGSIVAALFLEKFITNYPFIHCDIFAWNPDTQQAQAQGLNSLFTFIKNNPFS